MSLPVPQLDDRSFDDLVEEAKARIARACPQWTDFNPSDPGMMLVDLIAWATETMLYRLNRVPEKNYLKFLELIGVELKPLHPARTFVFFRVKQGVREEDLTPIPAGACLSTRPVAGSNPVVFETSQALNLTSRRIIRVLSCYRPNSGGERLVEHSLTGESIQPALLFQSGIPVGRCLYFGIRGLSEYGGRESLMLLVKLAQPMTGQSWWEWEAWNGERWELVLPKDATQGFRVDGSIQIDPLPVLEPLAVQELTRGQLTEPDEPLPVCWLRARLVGAEVTAAPEIREVKCQYRHSSLPPAKVLVATRAAEPLTLVPLPQPTEIEFWPFGVTPETGNSLYLESPLFQRPGSVITLEFDLQAGLGLADPESLEIRWEYRHVEGNWRLLGSSGTSGTITTDHGLTDGTEGFTKSGTVRFTCPESLAQAEVAGHSGWFVRARLERGQFRRPVQGTLLARSILCGMIEAPRSLDCCISENYDTFQKHPATEPITPFHFNLDLDPALYLCFDGPLSHGIHNLFFDVVHPEIDIEPLGVQIVWEYPAAQGWRALELQRDATRHFTRAGSVEFLSPEDWAAGVQFDLAGHWLRVRWEIPHLTHPPQLRQILLNGVEAVQALRQEKISSSSGEPGQSVALPSGVLPHPEVFIQETEVQTPDETRERKDQSEERLVEEVNGVTGRSIAWIKWEEVRTFYRSTPSDRHFTVDLRAQLVRFGDGKRGGVPPKGTNNIRSICRVSEGSKGDVGRSTIVVLDDDFPQVADVFNLHPAVGGTDPETIEDAKLRGPWITKHRDRAVTEDDFVELAKEASPVVGAARCYVEDGLVHVVVVPVGDEPKPLPNQRLISDVSNYLDARRLINARVRVEGPVYQTIEAQVRVVLRPTHQGHFGLVATRIRRALHRFVHPLHGGPEEKGWPMGRTLHLSELYYLLEGMQGVEVVDEVRIRPQHSVAWTATRIPIPPLGFPYFDPKMGITQATPR